MVNFIVGCVVSFVVGVIATGGYLAACNPSIKWTVKK
jgi:hypothetical protein